MNRPIVTFKEFQGFERFEDGSWFANLGGIKGHPRLGDQPYVHTSRILITHFDVKGPCDITTVNTIYLREDVDRANQVQMEMNLGETT